MRHHEAPNPLRRGAGEAEASEVEFTNSKHSADVKYDVHRALAKLPVVNRRIIVLRYFEEMTFKEAGEIMGISDEAARRLFVTSARALKAELERAGHGKSSITP
jgi:RNA polymerase sigma factor (sigma-70 family)